MNATLLSVLFLSFWIAIKGDLCTVTIDTAESIPYAVGCEVMTVNLEANGIFVNKDFSLFDGKDFVLKGGPNSVLRNSSLVFSSIRSVSISSITFENSSLSFDKTVANVTGCTFGSDSYTSNIAAVSSILSNLTFHSNVVKNYESDYGVVLVNQLGNSSISKSVFRNASPAIRSSSPISITGCVFDSNTRSVTTEVSAFSTVDSCTFIGGTFGVVNNEAMRISNSNFIKCSNPIIAYATLTSANNYFSRGLYGITSWAFSRDSGSTFNGTYNGITSFSGFNATNTTFESNVMAFHSENQASSLINCTFYNNYENTYYINSSVEITGSVFAFQRSLSPIIKTDGTGGLITDTLFEHRYRGEWPLVSSTLASSAELKLDGCRLQFNNFTDPLMAPLLRLRLMENLNNTTLSAINIGQSPAGAYLAANEVGCEAGIPEGVPIDLTYNDQTTSSLISGIVPVVQALSLGDAILVPRNGGNLNMVLTAQSRDSLVGYAVFLENKRCTLTGNVLRCPVDGISDNRIRYVRHCSSSVPFYQGNSLPPSISESYVLNGTVTVAGRNFVNSFVSLLSPSNTSICLGDFTFLSSSLLRCKYNQSAGTSFVLTIDGISVSGTLILRTPLTESISNVFEEVAKTNTSISVLINQAIGSFFGNFTSQNETVTVRTSNISLTAVKISNDTTDSVQLSLDNDGVFFTSALIENLRDENRVSFAAFYVLSRSSSAFLNTTQKSPSLEEKIYAVSLLDSDSVEVEVRNTSELISIKMTPSFNTSDNDVECIFWNERERLWSSEGCTVGEVTEKLVECLCNHLTNFSLSSNRKLAQQPSNNKDHTPLIVGLVVGLGGGILLLALIGLVVFLVMKKKKSPIGGDIELRTDDQISNLKFGEKMGSRDHVSFHACIYQNTTKVVVKLLDESKEANRFLNEIYMMKQVHHPNIVQYLGTANLEGKQGFVIETYSKNLKDYLVSPSKNRDSLLLIAKEVLSALSYLSEHKIVHGGVRSESIVLCGEGQYFTAKLEDFSWSRESHSKSQQQKFPIRWTAPEVLKGGDTSEESDIWSFGILLWEIFHDAQLPYHNLSEKEARGSIIRGEKLAISDEVPIEVNKMMTKCWMEPKLRPKPQELASLLFPLLPTAEEGKLQSEFNDVYIDTTSKGSR